MFLKCTSGKKGKEIFARNLKLRVNKNTSEDSLILPSLFHLKSNCQVVLNKFLYKMNLKIFAEIIKTFLEWKYLVLLTLYITTCLPFGNEKLYCHTCQVMISLRNFFFFILKYRNIKLFYSKAHHRTIVCVRVVMEHYYRFQLFKT